jgi:hypothetical protein
MLPALKPQQSNQSGPKPKHSLPKREKKIKAAASSSLQISAPPFCSHARALYSLI